MRRKEQYQVVLAVVAVLLLLLAQAVFAAETTVESAGDTVTLNLKDTDVRVALEALFRSAGRDFAIDPGINGPVPSLSFNGVPFDTALKSIIKSAGLTYRIDNGIYMISRKIDTPRTAGDGPPIPTPEPVVETAEEVTIEKIPLNYSSASEILSIMNGDYEDLSYGNGGFGSYGSGYGGNGGFGGNGSSGYGGYGGINTGGSYGGNYGRSSGGSYGGGYGGYSGGYGGYSGGGIRNW